MAELPAAQQIIGVRLVRALQQGAALYTAPQAQPKIALDAVRFSRVIDPGNQLPGYEGVWRNARDERCGYVAFNSDGSFYAEYDLFCAHPRDPRWFVEMITAWGRDETLRCEAKMIPSL
jgi:hypothetical protein